MLDFAPMAYVPQEIRRRQLIEAAVRVLQRDGRAGVTTRAIATEAGAPLASIHYTFGAKEDILRAAFEHVIALLLSELDRAVPCGRGVAATVAAVFTRVGQLLDNPQFAIVLGDITPTNDPWMRKQVETVIRFAEHLLRREARAASEPAPSVGYAAAARLLMAAVDGLVLQLEMHGDIARTRADLSAMGKILGAALGHSANK